MVESGAFRMDTCPASRLRFSSWSIQLDVRFSLTPVRKSALRIELTSGHRGRSGPPAPPTRSRRPPAPEDSIPYGCPTRACGWIWCSGALLSSQHRRNEQRSGVRDSRLQTTIPPVLMGRHLVGRTPRPVSQGAGSRGRDYRRAVHGAAVPRCSSSRKARTRVGTSRVLG